MDKNEELINKADFLATVCYMLALSTDLLLRESESLLKRAVPSQHWQHEKKQLLTRYLESVKRSCILNDQISEYVFNTCKKYDYKTVQPWQEMYNTMARFALLLADRFSDKEVTNKIEEYIKQIPGDGDCDEELLKNFYLRMPRE